MSAPTAAALARLEEIVGATSLIADAARLERYAVDGMQPAAAARPGSAEDVTEIVRFAAAEKLAVIPVGGRTKLGIGAPPRRYDLAIDLTRLNRVLAYDPGDLTLGVEPGIRLADLSAVLAEHGQFLPLAGPYTNQATVGGTIASGVDAPLRQVYGTARDYLLGLEFVTGEGWPAKSGGRVVKNVTGYDLHKLLIGSLGTLGVITRLNFRSFPLPPISRGFLAAFENVASALELRRRIVSSPLTPATLEILSPEVAQLFSRATPATLDPLPVPGPWLEASAWTLAADIGGKESVVERHVRELTRLAEQAGARRIIALGDAERLAVWGRLREFIPLVLQSSPAAAVVKMNLLPSRLEEGFAEARRIAEQYELPSCALARGVGVMYAALLSPERDEEALSRLARASAEFFQAAGNLGGTAAIPWCPAELKQRVNVWGPTRDDFVLMQRLKKAFDPHGILSPGRFVGGI